jgi:hypothetical protein
MPVSGLEIEPCVLNFVCQVFLSAACIGLGTETVE